jgi:hypothetical protein
MINLFNKISGHAFAYNRIVTLSCYKIFMQKHDLYIYIIFLPYYFILFNKLAISIAETAHS